MRRHLGDEGDRVKLSIEQARIRSGIASFFVCRFCDRHGPNKSVNKGKAPTDLMCVAEAMMPRIILRLIQHLRENR